MGFAPLSPQGEKETPSSHEKGKEKGNRHAPSKGKDICRFDIKEKSVIATTVERLWSVLSANIALVVWRTSTDGQRRAKAHTGRDRWTLTENQMFH